MAAAAHQIATRALGGAVSIAIYRDPADGAVSYGVSYASLGAQWSSRLRFVDQDQAAAGAMVLGEFLGAAVRQ